LYCPEGNQDEVRLFYFAKGLMHLPEIEEYVSTII